ncbi:nuclear transport factor 2 family protein [Mycobacteroides abscessus]|uniref:nuclear transport factor 2 family protein n=1 Tax=Mycobacteroides abscessus TaxID=36809 RepID=UPI0009A6A7CE|nr:Ketosteroid isomerase-related protein [Mycobacteroides abscessus subsp. bolletii]
MQQITLTDVVRRYYIEVDNGDVDRIMGLFEIDAEYCRPGYAPLKGRKEIRLFYLNKRVIQSGKHDIKTIISDSGMVAIEGEFKGTLRSGADMIARFADFFWPGPNGLIQKRRTYFYTALV